MLDGDDIFSFVWDVKGAPEHESEDFWVVFEGFRREIPLLGRVNVTVASSELENRRDCHAFLSSVQRAKNAGGCRWEDAGIIHDLMATGMTATPSLVMTLSTTASQASRRRSKEGSRKKRRRKKRKSRIAPPPKSPPIPTPVEKVDGDLVIPRDLAKMSDEELDGDEESATKTGTGVGLTCVQTTFAYNTDPRMMWLGMDVFETALETQMSVQSRSNLGVTADCEYLAQYGSRDNATQQILNDWSTVGVLYKVCRVALEIMQGSTWWKEMGHDSRFHSVKSKGSLKVKTRVVSRDGREK
ncbi:hypothetical protein C8J56DRAFT_892302 [Mycena floridula]|nr:hypothetical protein C8J56DRAFT_892302 [Mycena floridula]